MSGASNLPPHPQSSGSPQMASISVPSQAGPASGNMGAILWGQPQPFQAFMHAAAQHTPGGPSQPPPAFVPPVGYHPPSPGPHHGGYPGPPPHVHPSALPPGYVASPPRGAPFYAPLPHHPLAPHPHAHPLAPHHPHPHAMGRSPAGWPAAVPPPPGAVYDVKTIERHIHQLLRGGPIEDEASSMNGGDGADGGDRAAAPHQTEAEPATATATRRTASNGTHDEEEGEGNHHHGAGPAEGGATEGRSEAVSHQVANGGTATSNGAHERGPRGARNRGRRERRNSNSGGGPAAATARPRSNSGKATNNGVGMGGGGRPATTTNSGDNSAATTATTMDRDGRRPRTLQKQQGKPEKPASKFQRQGQRGANGTTAPATSHRRLPPPEVLAPAAATTPTGGAATAADVEDITHGVHAMGRAQQHSSSSSSKQQWIAKGPLPAKPTSTTSPVDADAQPAAAAVPPPVVVQLPPRQKAPRVALEREKRAKIAKDMLLSFETMRPSDQEMQAKLDVIKRLQRIVGNLWPGYQAKLNLFGSSANGFCLKNSDLDICMTIDKRAGTKKKIVNRIARVLREHKMKDVTALSHASVPIVKFEDPLSKFSCDICINNILALHNTHMIAQYSRVDSRLLQLGYFVKHWAKCRKLDEPYTGTLSSYAWILLVINFLQQRSPPVLPCLQRVAPSGDLRGDVPVVMVKGHNCYYYSDDIKRLRFRSQNQETLAELLLEFFYLYAEEFDYEHMVVSVRRGTMLTKKEKRWDKLPKTVKENHWFSIEDPFDLTHDLGRVVDQDNLKAIQHEFRRAYTLLTTTSDLAEVCEQYTSD